VGARSAATILPYLHVLDEEAAAAVDAGAGEDGGLSGECDGVAAEGGGEGAGLSGSSGVLGEVVIGGHEGMVR
jgi:hypothetical protein